MQIMSEAEREFFHEKAGAFISEGYSTEEAEAAVLDIIRRNRVAETKVTAPHTYSKKDASVNTDQLKAQFSHGAAGARTAQGIRDAITSLPVGAADQITDFITEICKIKGIDPQDPAILDVYIQTAEYKKAADAELKWAGLDRVFSTLETITKEYRENESRGALPTQEQIDTITGSIKKQTAKLGVARGKQRTYSTINYLQECLNYDPTKDFAPALFNGLAFPDGTVSYIGARTSRGKTTAMINLAREAITGKQPRKTIFITLEMSGRQILNKLILSIAFSMGISADEYNNPKNRREFLTVSANREIYNVWKNRDITGSGANTFRSYVQNAYNIIHKAQTDSAFILYDGRGATEPEIINFIMSQAEKGTLVLLDYIQNMPAKPETDTDSFRKVQAISLDVVNTAAETGSIIIAGAQFNRGAGSDASGDLLNDQSFRESGDLEQDAHNAIGIGWTTDKQGRFYEVLKTREDNKQGTLCEIDFCGGYSYMNHLKQISRSCAKTKNTAGKKSEAPDENELTERRHFPE